MTTPLLVIAGPTGSGKSAAALAVAEAFTGTIVNADSMQVYRDLPVITGWPDADTMRRVPHHLYGVLDVAERCSAARWCELAGVEIEAATAAGRLPILVGGTGLYLKAIGEGLAAVPTIPDGLRALGAARLEALGRAGFAAELMARDPEGSERIRILDRQRLLRAWEVLEATGRPLRDWQRAAPNAAKPRWRTLTLLLMPPRGPLYAALDARFQAMLRDGALGEVAALAARDLAPSLPAMKALGVPALLAHVAGALSLAQATAAAQQATRQYAKRQTTWFRYQIRDPVSVSAQFSESLTSEIFSIIRQFMLTESR